MLYLKDNYLKIGRLVNEWRHGFLISAARLSGGYFFLKPRQIGIEPTNRCNLSCLMCVRRAWNKEDNPLGDMPLDLFRNKILSFLSPFQSVNLQCLGEALLAGTFFVMAREIKKKGCRLTFITNGTLLKRYAEDIIDVGFDVITVSIDGTASLKKLRGIEIGAVIENIRALQAWARSAGKPLTELRVNFVLLRDNIEELPEVVELARGLNIKSVTVIQAVIHSRELLGQSLFNHPDIARRYFSIAADKAKELGVGLYLPPLEERSRDCVEPFTTLYINWNGDVRPCCIATINEKNTLKLGNLRYSSLPELWNGPMMRKLRLSLLNGEGLFEFCRNCSLRVHSLRSHTRILGDEENR